MANMVIKLCNFSAPNMPFDKNNRPKALLDLYDKVIFFLFVKFMNRGTRTFQRYLI